jgi:hypothetical protein
MVAGRSIKDPEESLPLGAKMLWQEFKGLVTQDPVGARVIDSYLMGVIDIDSFWFHLAIAQSMAKQDWLDGVIRSEYTATSESQSDAPRS